MPLAVANGGQCTTVSSPLHSGLRRIRGVRASSRGRRNCMPCSSGTCTEMTSDLLAVALTGSFPNAALLASQPLPRLAGSRHYVNLTNGIEAIPALEALGLPYSFCRLTSTACEQQDYDKVLTELDADLLVSLALGRSCLVWDAGCRHQRSGCPRALWLGLEWVRFALTRLWVPGARPEAYVRGHRVSASFERQYQALCPGLVRRLKYYRRFVGTAATPAEPAVRLYGVYRRTVRDSDVQFHVEVLRRAEQGWASPASPASPAESAAAHPRKTDADMYGMLRDDGWRLFLGGISHRHYQMALEAFGQL